MAKIVRNKIKGRKKIEGRRTKIRITDARF
jgi:hypothetical protein